MSSSFRPSRHNKARRLLAAVRGVEMLEGRRLFAGAVSPRPPTADLAKAGATSAKTVDLKHKAAATTATAPSAREAATSATLAAASLVINNDSKTYATLPDTTVTLTGRAELKITDSGNPISGSVINLNSADAWLFLPAIKPSVVNATYLSQVRVNGAVAVHGTNVRVVQHEMGTVVIPHAPNFQPLTAYTGPNFSGTAKSFGQYTYYNTGASLGTMFKNVSSFKLKRGYMATVATQANGTGTSRVFIAQDGDLDVGLMPNGLDNAVQFVRVFPWRWVAKKGASDVTPQTLDAGWFYNWNNNDASTLDYEYVPIRQQRWWPDLPTNQANVTHMLGFNEPDNPVEDAYKTLDNGNVDTAIAVWPELQASGVRLGSPAVTDGGKAWLYSFMDKALAKGLRVDYIAIHNYQAGKTAASFKAWLQDIWDRYHKPIWVTEFNNGANWTGNPPTYDGNGVAIDSFIQMMDDTPWIERYSIFSNVEDVRKVTYPNGSLTPAGVKYKANASPIGYQQDAAPAANTAGRSVARLPMEGSTADASGFGNNGQAIGAPAFAAGKIGQAMVFDGVDDAVRLSENVGRSANGFSFAGWVNWDGGADWQRVFDFGTGTNAYAFLSPAGGGKMRFAVKNGGAEQIVETAALPVGQWTHVAVTLAGNSARLYVNGTLAATNAAVTIKPSDFAPTQNYLGKSQYAADALFKGRLDEVLVTDYALTAAQVAALMTNAAPQFGAAELSRGPARTGVPFVGTIAGTATDADSGDTLTYAKANGPAWLVIAANGALSGTPTATDKFPQEFVVTATDTRGAVTSATLTLTENRGVVQLPFDGSATDTGGFNNTPTVSGTPAYVAGRRGQALQLDGATQYVKMTDNVAHGDEFGFAAWVNWNGGAAWQRVFDFGNDTSSFLFLTPSNGSQMQLSLLSGGTAYDLRAAALPVGQWTHVGVTIGAGAIKLYVNGVLAASNTSAAIRPSDFRPTNNYLGKSQFAADALFGGKLDDVQVTDYAFTAQQIVALMNATGAPTIQTAAAATTVAGTNKATLTVLGDDDDGEANLTYTWSVVGKPAGVADPVFGVNASNAAKTTVATFSSAGTYTLMAAVRDAGGLTSTSSVTYVVTPTLSGIAPATATVVQGTSIAVKGVDQFGQPMPIGGATWSSAAGTISASGLFTAPAGSAAGVTITATLGGTTFTTAVNVIAARGWYRADVASGTTLVDSSGSANPGTLNGATAYTAGKAGTALDLSGGGYATLPAAAVSGTAGFTFAAWVNPTTLANWARIFDFGSGTNAYMNLTASAGGTNALRFAITTTGTAGEQAVAGPAIPVGAWTHVAVTLNGFIGTLYVNGTAVASASGVTLSPANLGTLTQSYLGKSQFATDPAFSGKLDDVRVFGSALPAATIAAIYNAAGAPTVATAAAASSAVVTGKTTAVSVLGADDAGEAGLSYVWTATGPAAVAFSGNGTNAAKNAVATFAKAGTYVLTATITDATGLSTSSSVNVSVESTLTAITVTPAAATVANGQTLASTAVGYDQFGDATVSQPPFVWLVDTGPDGGTISAEGVYTAPPAGSGPVTVRASAADGVFGTASFDLGDAVAPVLVSAVSRKTHATAGTSDLPLALGPIPTTDPRSGGPNTLVLTLSESVRAVDGSIDANEFAITNARFVSVTLSGVTLTLTLADVVNAADVSVSLQGMTDAAGNAMAAAGVTVRALAADANRDGRVNFADFVLLQSEFGTAGTASDFDANGMVDFADFVLMQSAYGSGMA